MASISPGIEGSVATLINLGGGPGATASVDLNTFIPSPTGTYNPSSRIEAVDDGNYDNDIVFLSNKAGSPNNGLVENVRITSTGNVGIGTDSPRSLLEVAAAGPGTLGPVATLTNTGGGQGAAASVDLNTFPPSSTGTYNPSSRIEAVDDGNYGNDIVFLSNKAGGPNSGLVEQMRITSTGDIKVIGDVLLTGADCAEHFDVAGGRPPEPGTVVVIDDGGALRESRVAYDKKVAGVVSGAGDYRHGLVLDKRSSDERRVPVALVGKVYCKVDAQQSPIDVGDLLTTSATPGHAMKATDSIRAFGAIIGKALKALPRGTGLIPILVALQ